MPFFAEAMMLTLFITHICIFLRKNFWEKLKKKKKQIIIRPREEKNKKQKKPCPRPIDTGLPLLKTLPRP